LPISLVDGVEDGAQVVGHLLWQDDEAFTYNKRLNRLATIQEHLMIGRAVDLGVSEERLAKALNLDVRAIRRRRTMLWASPLASAKAYRMMPLRRAVDGSCQPATKFGDAGTI
jgi:hypothetical protein